MPKFSGLQFLYGTLAIISTVLASVAFVGFFFSVCMWDIESAFGTGILFGFFSFLAGVMGRLMER